MVRIGQKTGKNNASVCFVLEVITLEMCGTRRGYVIGLGTDCHHHYVSCQMYPATELSA